MSELHQAVFTESLAEVYRSLDAGNDVNETDHTGQTPLMLAVANENIRIIELLLNRGANVNASGHNEWQALHHAVDISIYGTIQANGSAGSDPVSIIDILIGCGADLLSKNNEGHTPLDIARIYGNKKVTDHLLKKYERE